MGRSMYAYGKQTKEKERQRKQIEKNEKRALAKQQKATLKESALPEGEAVPERQEEDE